VNHVIAVAQRLNYRPNSVARGLVTGRSHSLGLIVSDIRNPFFADVARGAADAARAQSCDLVLCNSDLDAARQMGYVQSLIEKRVDGILMNSIAALSVAEQRQLEEYRVPIVLLNRSANSRAFSTVSADNEAGGALAAQYLLGLGHRNIALITGPPQHGNLSDRTRGFVETLARHEPAVEPTILTAPSTSKPAAPSPRTLREAPPTPPPSSPPTTSWPSVSSAPPSTSAFASPMTYPSSASTTSNFSTIIQPPLTTIHQPKYELGQAAVEILLRMAADKSRPVESRVLGVELIERESCRRLK
jgi:LacI family transcriptional regulator